MRRLQPAVLVSLVLATMASGQSGSKIHGDESHTVNQVEITGNRRISAKKIFAAIATRDGAKFDPAQIDRDVRCIYGLGHFKDVKALSDDDWQRVIFEVEEWPLITGIAFEGMSSDIVSMATAEWNKKGIRVKIDSEYLPQEVKRAAKVVQDFMQRKGYSDPEVDIEVENVSRNEVVVRFKAE